jgi:two-component system response regulator AlgR
VRIHRNSLVARRHIRALEKTAEGNYVVLLHNCADELPVSRRHQAEALRQIRTGH